MIPFPEIDPVLFSLGPLKIRWYGISYVAGILLGWLYARHLVKRFAKKIAVTDLDDFITWATIGIVTGGRLGYVLFYKPMEYLAKPWEALYVWEGGMSFHGGLIGVAAVIIWFCLKRNIPILGFGDIIASTAPIGLFFGRMANFINSEHYGRVSDVPWAIIFPTGGPLPRHPSQIYEAGLEGIFLFLILLTLERTTTLRRTRPGMMFAVFLTGYGFARVFVEFFREPDYHIGYFVGGTTMGQLLSTPILLVGALLTWHVLSQKKSA